MLKYLIYFSILITIGACEKYEDDYILTTGETKKMDLVNHDIRIEANYTGGSKQVDSIEIDIDFDGTSDIIGFSILDTIYPEGYYKELSIEITNNEFVFAQHSNSGCFYAIPQVNYLSNGTFPIKQYVYDFECNKIPNASDYKIGNVPMFTLGDQVVNEADYNWQSSQFSKLNLKIPAYTPEPSYTTSVDNDSLIGNVYNFPDLCETLPLNDSFYLLFYKTIQNEKKYGWLEIKISGNEIWFIRSAIQI
ncbi:MAG: hypothetical protein AB8B74_10075 [Crocinitomicaceae bacterium]